MYNFSDGKKFFLFLTRNKLSDKQMYTYLGGVDNIPIDMIVLLDPIRKADRAPGFPFLYREIINTLSLHGTTRQSRIAVLVRTGSLNTSQPSKDPYRVYRDFDVFHL